MSATVLVGVKLRRWRTDGRAGVWISLETGKADLSLARLRLEEEEEDVMVGRLCLSRTVTKLSKMPESDGAMGLRVEDRS